MEASISLKEDLGRIIRRSRVLAGMGTREELAVASGLPVEMIRSFEKGRFEDAKPEEVRRAISPLGLNSESITYVDGLIRHIFSDPTKGTTSTVSPPTMKDRMLPRSRPSI